MHLQFLHNAIQFEITENSPILSENNGFDRRKITSPVRQLLWRSELEFVYGIAQSQVLQLNFYSV
jgi:hypothetical protein